MHFYKFRSFFGSYLYLASLCLALTACQPYQVPQNLSLIDLHNDARQHGVSCQSLSKRKAPPLAWNAQLELAAQKHSEDMYRQKYLSHINQANQNPGDRISAAGYQWRSYAENIAQGVYTDATAFELWLNSPGHCKNLINENYTEMGAAQVNGYWTAIYATP